MTTTTTVRSAFDGARAVEFSDDGRTAVVWHGGISFNVYAVGRRHSALTEFDVFSVSDEVGEPVDRETAVEHMTDWLNNHA